MDSQTRRDLITTLCSYPRLHERSGRDAWLLNLPPVVSNQIVRRNDDCKIDVTFIIDAVDGLQLSDGQWPILILLDDLLAETKGLAIYERLFDIRQTIEENLNPTTGEPPRELSSLPPINEIIIGKDEKVPVSFLEKGLKASRSVARVRVQRSIGGFALGTGWLITPDLLITNHHVIEARFPGESPATQDEFEHQSHGTVVWFGYDVGNYHEYRISQLVCFNKELDYAILRVAKGAIDHIPLEQWGFLEVVTFQPSLTPGARLNVIQHPGGRVKEIALRTNFFVGTDAEAGRFHYLSDTEGGSSGSPVLDDNWQVVGLHHAWDHFDRHYKNLPIRFDNLGLQYTVEKQLSGKSVPAINEGILLHTILNSLPSPVYAEIQQAQGWLS